MATNRTIIVTEGEFDARLLKILLREEIKGSNYVIKSASGYSSAISKTTTLLRISSDNIILLLDADSTSETEIEEKKDMVDLYVSAKHYKDRLDIIWLVPEFEQIFFNDDGYKPFVDNILNKEISKDTWAIAKNAPKKALEYLSGKTRDFILEKLTPDFIEALRNDAIIQRIINFAPASAEAA